MDAKVQGLGLLHETVFGTDRDLWRLFGLPDGLDGHRLEKLSPDERPCEQVHPSLDFGVVWDLREPVCKTIAFQFNSSSFLGHLPYEGKL